MSEGAAHCADCGRFVSNVVGHDAYGAIGPYLDFVTGTCAVHGEVEAVREWGWGWDDFEWPEGADCA